MAAFISRAALTGPLLSVPSGAGHCTLLAHLILCTACG